MPPRKIDTAKVKPERNDIAAVARYRLFSETAISEIDMGIKSRHSSTRYMHPWFGSFTAHQFHWLLAEHSETHHKQISNIKKMLV